ncbi:MAG: DAK2 domain-containing protein [Clostridia bacterium]|nr:DAK2 domain-containing protein [Clostridia bacterium]
MLSLDGNYFKNMFVCGANNLNINKTMINRLNVFPVPDGDTGSNMWLTMSVAVNAVKNSEEDNISSVSEKIAAALLRGARGNSGVILSLMFRGIAQGLKGAKNADTAMMASALGLGVEMAYKAVMKPTEGTMLTVARLSAEHMKKIAPECDGMETFFEQLAAKADEALKATPDMLPVLKQANVVDAGGMGLLVIYRGMLHYLMNGTMIEPAEISDSYEEMNEADFSFVDTEDIKFGYCTEFFINKDADKEERLPEFKTFLNDIGDSIVVVADDDIIKVHVHTNNPGRVIEEALTRGTLSKIKIENMREQHTQQLEISASENKLPTPRKPYGIVAICAGEGLKGIFEDMGADIVVDGGQTMNPSTDDILKAVNDTNSEVVFILPNNKNIIMSAKQTAEFTKDKRIEVIETKTVPQGIGAMLGFDADQSVENNVAAMNESVSMVSSGSVTYADRDSVYFEKEIKKGEFLALSEGELVDVSADRVETTVKLITDMCQSGAGLVTIYYGKDAPKDESEALLAICRERLGDDIEVNLVYGGQPVYYYIISAE